MALAANANQQLIGITNTNNPTFRATVPLPD